VREDFVEWWKSSRPENTDTARTIKALSVNIAISDCEKLNETSGMTAGVGINERLSVKRIVSVEVSGSKRDVVMSGDVVELCDAASEYDCEALREANRRDIDEEGVPSDAVTELEMLPGSV
jgi:hypothetical protein